MRVDWCVSSWFRIKNTHSHLRPSRAATHAGGPISIRDRFVSASSIPKQKLACCGAERPRHSRYGNQGAAEAQR